MRPIVLSASLSTSLTQTPPGFPLNEKHLSSYEIPHTYLADESTWNRLALGLSL